MPEGLQSLIHELNSVLYSTYGLLAQFIGLVLTIVLGYIWMRLMANQRVISTKIDEWKDAFGYEKPAELSRVDRQWESIQAKLSSNDESQWKVAVLEADSVLDKLIQAMGYKGDTMGSRMQQIKRRDLPMLDDAWRAHKVRNFIAHDPNYKLSREAAEKTIGIYERIFRQLNVLDND